MLPSGRFGRTTETVGYFALAADAFARRLCGELGKQWQLRGPIESTLDAIAETLARSELLDRYVMIELSGWTALLTNGPLGTDVGVLPSWVARKMGALGIRASAAAPGADSGRYGSTILEVYDPVVTDQVLRRRRTIAAADDGGRWVFETSGEPFDFEDTAAYERPRISDRFDPELLEDYLRALGVPIDLDAEHLVVYVVERRPAPAN